MKNIISTFLFLVFGAYLANAQQYFTRTGEVSFHSRALLEDIDAFNNQGTFVMDSDTKKVQMAVLIKAFQFEKALMQEHFNENYMESDQYPKAVFSGTMEIPGKLDLESNGEYGPYPVNGELTIRGITRPIATTARFSRSGESLQATTQFNVAVADYEISVPKIVRDKIAKEVEIRVSLELEKM